MKPSDRLAAHRDRVLAILDRASLGNPRLFGSAARREDGDASDLDILVEAHPATSLFDLAAVEFELEHLLGCRIELLTDGFLAPDVRSRVKTDLVPLK